MGSASSTTRNDRTVTPQPIVTSSVASQPAPQQPTAPFLPQNPNANRPLPPFPGNTDIRNEQVKVHPGVGYSPVAMPKPSNREFNSGFVNNHYNKQMDQQSHGSLDDSSDDEDEVDGGVSSRSHGNRIKNPRSDHDLVLSRVMAVDEFLGRMDETDEKVLRLTRDEDAKRRNLSKIINCLGLRGHLQDELLRIQAMLAEDDPTLRSLKPFEIAHTRAVTRLKEIGVIAQQLKEVTMPSAPFIQNSTHEQFRNPSQFPVQENYHAEQLDVDDKLSTEVTAARNELKIKHDEEERKVAENFALHLIRERRSVEARDVDELLQNHLIAMHTLRRRQALERDEKLRQVTDAAANQLPHSYQVTNAATNQLSDINRVTNAAVNKLSERNRVTDVPANQRLNTDIKNQSTDEIVSSVDSQTVTIFGGILQTKLETDRTNHRNLSTMTDGMENNGLTRSFAAGTILDATEVTSDNQNFDSTNSDKKNLLREKVESMIQKKMKDNRSTSEDLKNILKEFRSDQDARQQLLDHEQSRHNDLLRQRMAQRNQHGRFTDEDATLASQTDAPDEHDDEEYEIAEKITDLNQDFVEKIASTRQNSALDDFNVMLRTHLANSEAIQRQRLEEKARLNDKMKERLATRPKNSEDDITTNANTLSPDETMEKLKLLNSKFHKKIARKVSRFSDDELRELLEAHRIDQQNLVRQRESDKSRTDQILEERLKSRNKQKINEMDESFVKQLESMKQSGTFGEEAVREIVSNYLRQTTDSRNSARKKRKKDKEQRDQSVKESAQSILSEYQAQAKQIINLRQKERSITDERLQERLKNRRVN